MYNVDIRVKSSNLDFYSYLNPRDRARKFELPGQIISSVSHERSSVIRGVATSVDGKWEGFRPSAIHNWGNQSFVLALTRIAEGNRGTRRF